MQSKSGRIVAIVATAALAGCAQLTALVSSVGEQDLAVQFATLKYIEGAGKAEAQAERAARVRAVVDEVDVRLGDAVTVAALKALVLSRLPADLDPSDRLLAGALVDAVARELEGKIDDGVLDPNAVIALRSVLANVREATSYFGIA